MEDIIRVNAGIMPGPVASLTMMSDLQIAQINGASDHPQEMITKHCHDKVEKLSATLQTILDDIQRLQAMDAPQAGQSRAGGTSLEVAPGRILDPIAIHKHLQTVHTWDTDRTRDFPFCWLFRNYSAKFAKHFLTALLGDP